MKRVNNILTEKQAQLTTLMHQSSDAVSLITRTVDNLEQVNGRITEVRSEIAGYQSELARLDGSMGEQFDHNARIIDKFKAFLED